MAWMRPSSTRCASSDACEEGRVAHVWMTAEKAVVNMCGLWEFAQRYGSLLSVTCLRLSRTDFELIPPGPDQVELRRIAEEEQEANERGKVRVCVVCN